MNVTIQSGFAVGELVAGKYRVERVLGEGGMGVVLAARHEQLATPVALKLLKGDALAHPAVVGRFLREARAAVSLRSEHVARVHDVGTLPDGRPYIVMERLEGKDLGEVIETEPPLAIADAVGYVLQACEAIAEAHAAGIVHRDLKPKNLFRTHAVDGSPLVKVLDFGISKVAADAGPQDHQLTRTTDVIGSPSYMSPEQLRASRDVDARTDIWALGVILYELLTGRVPFHADTMPALVLVVATEREVPIRSVRPDCPEAVDAIVTRCLEKDPEKRFLSVVELVQALEPFGPTDQATVGARIRAVASAGRAGASVPVPSPSSRVNVPGSGSVAWGATTETAAAPTFSAAPPRKVSLGLVIGLFLGGVVVASAVGAGGFYLAKRTETKSPAASAGEPPMPLPSGRKDLPPLVSASAPTPSATLTASALPETRTLPTATTAPKAAPRPVPAPPKADDLSNIGRR